MHFDILSDIKRLSPKSRLRGAFQWWLNSLLLPLPGEWKKRLAPTRPLTTLVINEDTVHIRRRPQAGDASIHHERYVYNSLDNLQLSSHLKAGEPCLIALSHALILTRRITLPMAPREHLPQILKYEIDRLLPFNSEEVVFCYKLAESPPNTRQLSVDLFVCRKSLLQAIDTALAEHHPSPIIAPCNGQDEVLPLDFMASRPGNSATFLHYRWPIKAKLLGYIVLALLSLCWIPLLVYQQKITALSNTLKTNQANALTIQQQYKMQDNENRLQQFMEMSLSSYVPPIMILEQLSQELPENIWIKNLSLSNGQLLVDGEAPSASTALLTIESNPLLYQAEFMAPISLTPERDKEIFQISASVGQAP